MTVMKGGGGGGGGGGEIGLNNNTFLYPTTLPNTASHIPLPIPAPSQWQWQGGGGGVTSC